MTDTTVAVPASGLAGLGRATLRRFGPSMSISLFSQVTSALGLVVLPFLGTHAADLYSLGLQAAFTGVSTITVGVVNNLVVGRPGFAHWRRLTLGAGVASLAATSVILAFAGSYPGISSSDKELCLGLFLLGGTMLAMAGCAAVRLACQGRPLALAGISIPPNVAFALAVVLAATTGNALLAPAVAWCIAAAACLVVVTRMSVAHAATQEAVEAPTTQGFAQHAFFLCLGVLTSAVVPLVLLSRASHLPAGTSVVLFISLRVAGAVSLTLNAALLVRFRWGSEGMRSTVGLSRLVAGALGIELAALALRAGGMHADANVAGACMFLALLVSQLGAAVLLREVNSRGDYSTIRLKVLVDITIAGTGTALYAAHPSIAGFLAVYLTSQWVTIGLCGRKVMARSTVIGAVGVATSLVLLLT